MRVLLTALLAMASLPAAAQRPDDALATRWNTICATASVSGGQLLVRCTETAASSSAFADQIAAEGQHLDEIPGQARAATRDGGTPSGGVQVHVAPALSMVATDPTASTVTLRLNAADDGDGGSLAAPWGLFASVEGGRIDRDTGPNEAGFDAGTLHATVGADVRVGAKAIVGLVANVSREDLEFVDSDGAAEADYRGVIAFGNVQLNDAWAVDGYAGYASGSNDLRRHVFYVLPMVGGGSVTVDEQAFADPDSTRAVYGVGASWNWSRGAWYGDVGAGTDFARTRIDPYVETGGGGLALEVPGRTIETRRGRVEARVGRTFSAAWGVWQPSLKLGWRREFANERRQVTVQLADDALDNLITFATEDPDRAWGEFALSSVFTFTRGHSGFIEYRQRFAHDFLHERVFGLGWRMEMR